MPGFFNDDLFLGPNDPALGLNLPRWIIASARYHFYENKKYPMFFEHAGPNTLLDNNNRIITDYTEFRLDGPFSKQVTHNETFHYIEINILAISTVTAANADKIEDILGSIYNIFTLNCFGVYKFGDNSTDDQSYIGAMILNVDKNDQIVVSRFGQANPDTKVAQASVEGHYQMRLVSK